jgi:hypothetical protein
MGLLLLFSFVDSAYRPYQPSAAPACLLLQGSLLSGLLAEPLHLSSITVSVQPAAQPAGEPAGAAAAAAAAATATSSDSSRQLAAAAAGALRRALLGRTASLAAERMPPGFFQAAPALHIHLPTAAAPAAPGTATSSDSSSSMQALGLAHSAARKVAGGSSLVWVAPASASFKWKQQRLPTGLPAGEGSGTTAVLSGGAVEGVIGSTGLKVGSARVQPGQAVHPSAQPSICKAALFAEWQQLAAAIKRLPPAGAAADNAAAAAAAAAGGMSYRHAKEAAGGAGYTAAWRRLLQPPSPLEGWIPKPAALEQFTLMAP